VLGPFAYHYLGRAPSWLAAVYLLAGLICLRFVAHVPPLPITRLSTLLRDVAGRAIRASSRLGGTFALIGAYGSNLASLLHHSPVRAELVHHFDTRLVSLVLVSAIAVLVIGIVLWTPWINRLDRRGRCGAPSRVPGSSQPRSWRPTASPRGLYILLPVAGLGILWLAGFGPAAVAYLANSSETHRADRSPSCPSTP